MEHQRGQKSSWGQKRLKGRLLQVEEGDDGASVRRSWGQKRLRGHLLQVEGGG